MRLIPDRPIDNNSRAEKKVFDAIKECFIDDNFFVAYHSIFLTAHEKKRVGEADFVILCKFGVFVLEVKGGGISCEEGKWFTKNTQGKQYYQPCTHTSCSYNILSFPVFLTGYEIANIPKDNK